MKFQSLPIWRKRRGILKMLAHNRVLVVESPTGSGKTTQLPIILHKAGYAKRGIIGVTQPRRIAAVSVSDYIAQRLGEKEPVVAYKMRFEDTTTPKTRIKVMTDGILLQELKHDPDLLAYSVIMIDEAHERSLNIDFILGLLKRIVEKRPDVRLIISSATINTAVFSGYFWDCPILRINAPSYPVETIYEPPALSDNLEALLSTITGIVQRRIAAKTKGDILIFLPGEFAIKECIRLLDELPDSGNLLLRPLYGRLRKEEQDAIFLSPPADKIKVIVATNIAETSITIDGICAVIDSGLANMNSYNPHNYTSSLIQAPISQASSNQRLGRAGRTRPGVCYRLYSESDYEQRDAFTLEEIYRTDLSEVVLRMAELEILDFETFDFISSPGQEDIAGAVETLRMLKALEPNNSLSAIGRIMARFPLLPRHSRMIVEAMQRYPEVLEETIVAASFLTSNTPFLLPTGEEMEARRAYRQFRDELGDFVTWLKLLEAFEQASDREAFCKQYYLDQKITSDILNVKRQLIEIVEQGGYRVTGGGLLADYLCAVAKGLIQFVCVRTGRRAYRSLTEQKIYIHPGSVMFDESPRFIVAGEIVRTSRTYARSVSPIDRRWLRRISPSLSQRLVHYDSERKPRRRRAGREVSIGGHRFRVIIRKNRQRIAILPFARLKSALERHSGDLLPLFTGLRGRVMHGDMEILSDVKLEEIVRIVPHFELDRDLVSREALGANIDIESQYLEICSKLDLLPKLCHLSKSALKLGFIALHCDRDGHYWFKPLQDYYASLGISLDSLKQLTNDVDRVSGGEQSCKQQVNAAYRRLKKLYDT